MRKLAVFVSGVLLSALIVPVALAEGPESAQKAGSEVPAATGKVPQARVDYIKKREEAKKRRDALLKKRQQTIKSAGPGNVGGK